MFRARYSLPFSIIKRMIGLTAIKREDIDSIRLTYKSPSKIKQEFFPLPVYGGRTLVTLIPGIGIGPELCGHFKEVFHAANVPVDFEIIETSPTGEMLNEADLWNYSVQSIMRNRIAIKGSLSVPGTTNAFLRAELDLYVFLIHFKSMPKIPARFESVDLVLIRQNTEGEYAMLEHESVKGVVKHMKITTRENIHRLAQWAFSFARNNNRKKITVVFNDTNYILSEPLFLETCLEVGKTYPEIQCEKISLGCICKKIVLEPHDYDVLLLPNLYGNIVTNIICGMLGGPGIFFGVNYGTNHIVFESAIRQKGMNLAGKDIANPMALLCAGVNMLRHIGHIGHADLIDKAVMRTIIENEMRTPDIGGKHKTSVIIEMIKCYILEDLSKNKATYF